MSAPAVPIDIPVRCATCGRSPPPAVAPEVARWHGIAAGLYREARQAFKEGRTKAVHSLRRRAIAALDRAAWEQAGVEAGS